MKRILLTLITLTAGMFMLASEETAALSDGVYAKISTAKGDLLFQLDYENLPLTVSNFVANAEDKTETSSYEDLSFYKVIPGYALFSGEAEDNGKGDYTFPRENGGQYSNGTPGAITMASRQGEDHGSRFMILIGGDAFLDSKYTAFAKIIQGQEVLGKIRENSKAKIEILRIGAEAEAFQPDRNSVAALIEDAREKSREEFARKYPVVAEILVSLGEGVQKSETGIYYKVHKEGKGGNPRPGNTVQMHYSGRLLSGQEFDNSYLRGEPFSFTLGEDGVIPGWVETALSMQPGEQRTILLPPELAYGSKGYGPIPPDAWLIFDIELIDFQ